jgi:hypothetical protein
LIDRRHEQTRDADHEHNGECNQDLFHSARSAAPGFSRLSDQIATTNSPAPEELAPMLRFTDCCFPLLA